MDAVINNNNKNSTYFEEEEEGVHTLKNTTYSRTVVKDAAIHLRVGRIIETTTEIALRALQVSEPSKC